MIVAKCVHNFGDVMSEELETKNNVIVMGDFLLRRFHDLKERHDNLLAHAKKLSKKDDPRADPFAAHVMHKADKLETQMEKVSAQIRFIMRQSSMNPMPKHPNPEPENTPPPVRVPKLSSFNFVPHKPVT